MITKWKLPIAFCLVLALALLGSASPGVAQQGSPDKPLAAAAIGTAFTYQGSLKDGGALANAQYDFQFKLFDAASGTGQVGSTITIGDVPVNNGLFTVSLDFGSSAFAGNPRWLEIAVRPGASTGSYTTLTPRQPLNPAPYALYTSNADKLDGADASGFLSTSGGTITGDLFIDSGGKLGVGTTTPEAPFEAINPAGAFKLQSGKAVGAITLGGKSGTLYQFAGAQQYGGTGQMNGGFGVAAGSNLLSPIIWMYNASDNVFQVRTKGFSTTVQDGSVLLSVNQNGTTSVKILQITGGSDLAEPFEIFGAENVVPGMLVSIDSEHPGQLRIAEGAYDHTVAGCVSGAGGVQPGLVMQQEGSAASGAFPVALSGRVYCWADASYGPIRPGDLLTSSNTPGHVMAISDYAKAQGAIVGKAMSALEKGVGLILVLVTLQ